MRVKKCYVVLSLILIVSFISPQNIVNATPSKSETQSQYDEAMKKVEAANDKIRKCDDKINTLLTKQKETEAAIDAKQKEIADKEANINESSKNLADKEDDFKDRIRNTYKNGNDTTLSIILDAESLGDLIERKEIVRNVSLSDIRAMQKIKETKDSLDEEKRSLEKEVSELDTLKNDLQGQIDTINTEKAASEKARKEAEALKTKYAAELEAINKSIAAEAQQIGGTTNTGTATVSNVLAEAKKHLGKQYVWGATGPNTFDCSGFTQYVYKKCGISLTRTTYTQVKGIGTYVAPGNEKPGDLVFFGSLKSPHHVGIYVGNGIFIHAPQTGDVVKYTKLIYMTDYTQARRIIS
ncbi:Hypothetical protein CM240_0165 [Clostridium bornimense]|uniref:NlpC/P60 domain-containing protein n=1 Tax=Clostridium bornimense TaxID=1216932 RepID=W6RUP6_9CLOT|nr:C40 family peptidase [Clostridium bornimense]CDM67339.1 Hypothetical protein CM240_0165 [Clostridium bornimense]